MQITTFDVATGVAIDSEDRVVVVGTTNTGTVAQAAVAHFFTEKGKLDTSFAVGESSIPGVFLLDLGPDDMTGAAAVALTQDDENIHVRASKEH